MSEKKDNTLAINIETGKDRCGHWKFKADITFNGLNETYYDDACCETQQAAVERGKEFAEFIAKRVSNDLGVEFEKVAELKASNNQPTIH